MPFPSNKIYKQIARPLQYWETWSKNQHKNRNPSWLWTMFLNPGIEIRDPQIDPMCSRWQYLSCKKVGINSFIQLWDIVAMLYVIRVKLCDKNTDKQKVNNPKQDLNKHILIKSWTVCLSVCVLMCVCVTKCQLHDIHQYISPVWRNWSQSFCKWQVWSFTTQ